jgi:hypothetical protein
MEKPKMKISSIGVILTLTVAVILITLPLVQSAVELEQPMFIFVGAAPSPVGVGQPVALVYWTSEMPMPGDDDAVYTDSGREHWRGVTLTVKKPDGSEVTLDAGVSDPVGGGYYLYTPDMTGTYSVVASMPEQWKNRTTVIPYGASKWRTLPIGEYYFGPATSDPAEFVAQQNPIESWPPAEPPIEFWSRPIDAGLREWSPIAGNWLGDGMDNPYTEGPETAHIMWTRQLDVGGITGEPYGTLSVYEGSSYERKWQNPIIMMGRLYYPQSLSSAGLGRTGTITKGTMCVDLRTGEEIFYMDDVLINRGEIYNYVSRNQHGTIPTLMATGGTTRYYDPFTGGYLYAITDVPSGWTAVGPNGERLIYQFGGYPLNRTWLALWNSTGMISQRGSSIIPSTGYDQWRPVGKEHNGTEGWEWNVTLPSGLGTGGDYHVLEDRIISGPGRTTGYSETYHTGYLPFGYAAPHGDFSLWAVSTAEGSRGDVLWNIQLDLPTPNATMQWGPASLEEGLVIMRCKETRQFIAYDIDTGAELWTTEPQNSWMMYSRGSSIADGKLFSGGYGGIMYAYDLDNGNLLWEATTDACGLEGPYDRWPISGFDVIDGKVYCTTGEHSHTHPLNRGWSMYCFDADTGDRLWDITGIWNSPIFADGSIVSVNGMDNRIYCFGKGPSAITVDAPLTAVPLGTGVMIRGMVTDESAGTRSDALMARFPNGVPAIADECMTEWMEYVYKQHSMPMATGVEVVLETLDPNGNYYEIGRVTSDGIGMYKMMWEPEVEGEYTIVATFSGSGAYYGSMAETAVGVAGEGAGAGAQGPPGPQGPQGEPGTDAEVSNLTLIAVGAIVVALVAIALAAYVFMRKR